jgi:hypothetical protein
MNIVIRLIAATIVCLTPIVHAQLAPPVSDPLTLPSPRPASKGAYQWGVEILKLDKAWALTKGRAHLAIVDTGFAMHPELKPGADGNYREHLSQADVIGEPPGNQYHATMVATTLAARGFDGIGISGACPWCSLSVHTGGPGTSVGPVELPTSMRNAIAVGASVVNMSFGDAADPNPANPQRSCLNGGFSGSWCDALRRAAERDLVMVSIAQNQSNAGTGAGSDRVPFPANHPNVIGVGGIDADGKFWSSGYESANSGSNWGPKIRLVAPAKDILVGQLPGRYLYDFPGLRCGDRVNAPVAEAPSLPANYAGYGDCIGTSFSAPYVSAIAGLVRSANPLLTAGEVQSIIEVTATQPVSGPAGSGLTFFLPDAERAVQAALGASMNRVTPVFSLYAANTQSHLFTSSPQMAVAGIARELKLAGQSVAGDYQSFGDEISGYARFGGRLCDSNGSNCTQPDARALFNVFTTENSPDTQRSLVPLYRMSQVCAALAAGCKSSRNFAYATSRSQVQALEARGYVVDGVEGYIYASGGTQPAGTQALCLGFDAARIDHILYAAASCTRTQLSNAAGQNTGGNYQPAGSLGFVPLSSVAAVANYTDLWWAGQSENGWGISINQHGNVQFNILFVYDNAGKAIWYAMPGCTWNADFTACNGALYKPSSSALNNYNPAQFAANPSVGSATFQYTGSGTGLLQYVINGIAGQKSISRQSFGPIDNTAGLQVGDMWWAGDSQNGWGVSITQQYRTLFAAWYTYDQSGNATWYTLPGGSWNGNTYSGKLYTATSSPWLGGTYNPAAFTAQEVGTISFNFSSGSAGTMSYTFTAGPFAGTTQTKNITRQAY